MPARLFRPKGGRLPGLRPAATPLPLSTRAFCFRCTGRVLRMASRNFWAPGSWHVLTVWFFSPHRPHLLGPLTGMVLNRELFKRFGAKRRGLWFLCHIFSWSGDVYAHTAAKSKQKIGPSLIYACTCITNFFAVRSQQRPFELDVRREVSPEWLFDTDLYTIRLNVRINIWEESFRM